jgi:hypothetical protein
MRHRSNIAFILLAAALFAAPQVSHDLSSFKGALAARIRGEILQAFLGLHSSESNGAPAESAAPARRAETVLASCDAPKAEGNEGKGSPVTPARAARRAEANARPDAREQAEMLGDPADKSNAGIPPAGDLAELASLPRESFDTLRLAMLTPPGNGVEPPPPTLVRYDFKTGVASREKLSEIEKHAVFVQARFEREAGNSEWIRRVAADAARAAEDNAKVRTRSMKRRQVRACGGDEAPAPLPAPAAKAEVPVQVSIGE